MIRYSLNGEVFNMECITIKNNDLNVLLFLNNNGFYGYEFYYDKVKSVDNNIINVFKYFKLSDNKEYIKKENGYDIYLDKDTNLKHYLKNGIESFNLLFLNNGVDAVSYLGNDNHKSKHKIFNIKNMVLVATSLGLILGINYYSTKRVEYVSRYENYMVSNDYSLLDIKSLINNSAFLTEEEKEYIYNEDFITDILKTINDSSFLKFQLQRKINNIRIESFEEDDGALGYYSVDHPNTLFLKDYNGLDIYSKDVVAHEFIHMCQGAYGYNLLTEACAEIISYEYYDETNLSSYYEQARLVKKLMEIIGPEAVWHYNFTGDFSKIRDAVQPYLTYDEYIDFLHDLTFSYDDYLDNVPKFKNLDSLLTKLYKSKFNKNIEDDEVIREINYNNRTLVRYYFNPRLINQENSYYIDDINKEYGVMSLEDAINEKYIIATAIAREPIDSSVAFILSNYGVFSITREIDYSSADIVIYQSTNSYKGLFITASINGVKYNDVNVDNLVKEGIINANYYLVTVKELSYEEYISKDYHYDSEVIISKANSTLVVSDDTVSGYFPTKRYIPTINDRVESINKILEK